MIIHSIIPFFSLTPYHGCHIFIVTKPKPHLIVYKKGKLNILNRGIRCGSCLIRVKIFTHPFGKAEAELLVHLLLYDLSL